MNANFRRLILALAFAFLPLLGTPQLATASQTAPTPLYHPPAAPLISSAMNANDQFVQLTWIDNSDNETVFRMEKLNADGVNYSQVGNIELANSTSGLEMGLVADRECTLRVVAIAPALIGLYETPSIPITVTPNQLTFTTVYIPSIPGAGGGALTGAGLVGAVGTSDHANVLQAGELKTPDIVFKLIFRPYIYIRSAAGFPQFEFSISPLANPPQASGQSKMVAACEVGPSGMIFVQSNDPFYPGSAVTISIAYSEAQIPTGIPETSFYIAIWDGIQWVKLPASMPDPATNSVTAQIAHTGNYALLAEAQSPVTKRYSALRCNYMDHFSFTGPHF